MITRKSISDLFSQMCRGLHRMSLRAHIADERKNLVLAEQGHVDVGRFLLPIGPEERAQIITRSQSAIDALHKEQQELSR